MKKYYLFTLLSFVLTFIAYGQPTVTMPSNQVCLGQYVYVTIQFNTVNPVDSAKIVYGDGRIELVHKSNITNNSIQNKAILYSQSGVLYFKVVGYPPSASADSTIKLIEILPLPILTIQYPFSEICLGNAVSISATVNMQGGTYSWSYGQNTASGATLTDIPTSTTNYTVNYVGPQGCSVTDNKIITVNPLPHAVFAYSVMPGSCSSPTVSLSAADAGSGVTYNWHHEVKGDLAQHGQEIEFTINEAMYTMSGMALTVVDGNGCVDADTVLMSLPNTIPPANFSSLDSAYAQTKVQFENKTNNQAYDEFQWAVNGDSVAATRSLDYTFNTEGTDTITMYSTMSSFPCTDTLVQTILILPSPFNSGGQDSILPNADYNGVDNGSVSFADVDGDGDQDMLIMGTDENGDPQTIIKYNDGNGNFLVNKAKAPFDQVGQGDAAFMDINGDGNQDILIAGISKVGQKSTTVYENDGDGNFTKATSFNFEAVDQSSLDITKDIGNGKKAILLAGKNTSGTAITKLYIQDNSGAFVLNSVSLDGVSNGDVAFLDINGDGNQDILITGISITKVYINDGNNGFNEATNTGLKNLSASSVAHTDLNNDGYSDLLIAGNDGSNPVTILYQNNGNNTFTKLEDLDGIDNGDVAFLDINGDGNQDILIAGVGIAEAYIGGDNGTFNQYTGELFKGVSNSAISYADVDGDGDVDILITGKLNNGEPSTKLYYSNNKCSNPLTPSTISINKNAGELKATNVSGAYTYQWIDCKDASAIQGENQTKFTPSNNGSYALEVTSLDGCTITSNCQNMTSLGIEANNMIGWKVYPNPNVGTFTIQKPQSMKEGTYSIYSLLGEEVQSGTIQNHQKTINIKDCPEGIYFLKVNKIKTFKIVKK